MLTLCVLLGGVLLHSMNVLITATLLPSVVAELGGANLMSWPTTAFVASSIVAASGTRLVSGKVWKPPGILGRRRHIRGGRRAVRMCALDWFCYRRTLRARIGGRLALGSRVCACTQCISRSAVAESLWPARGRLVGHRADRTFDWRRVRELWALAQRVCHRRGDREPARCWRPFHASSRQAERPGCYPDFSGGPRCLDLWRDRVLVGGERCDWTSDQGHAHHGNRCGVRPDDADRSVRSCSAPAKRCVLPTVRDWCGALDDTAHVCRIQPAGDLRAALFAALARGESARRWL